MDGLGIALLDETNVSRPLYFASVDIKGCYDTINQEKLLEIIEQVIKCDKYMLHKYSELNMEQGRVRMSFNTRASATGTHVKQGQANRR
jgi:hypothetical protein